MKINKRKVTTFILNMAVKFPFLFPKGIAFFAKSHQPDGEYSKLVMDGAKKFECISCFDGDFSWKSISISMLLDDNDLYKFKKWINANKINGTSNDGHNRIVASSSFDNSLGWMNVGVIPINRKGFFSDFSTMYVSTDYFKFINLSLTRYSAGLSFVTFYITLNEEVTNLINKIPTPEVKDFFEFSHFNLFSKRNNPIIMHGYERAYESAIKNNMIDVNDASISLVMLILKEMGINKKITDLFCVSDFCIEQFPPYFNNKNKKTEGVYALFPFDRSYLNRSISDNDIDEFIFRDDIKINGIDMIYMRIFPTALNQAMDFFHDRSFYNAHTHLSMAPIYLIYNKINKLSEKAGAINLYNTKKSIGVFHEDIFLISQEIKMIDVWLSKMKKHCFYYIPDEFHRETNNYLDNMTERVGELKLAINDSYALSENRVQVSNIKYNKLYSKIVFILVITQIILAAMTIDFLKVDAWYSPMIKYVMDFFSN